MQVKKVSKIVPKARRRTRDNMHQTCASRDVLETSLYRAHWNATRNSTIARNQDDANCTWIRGVAGPDPTIAPVAAGAARPVWCAGGARRDASYARGDER
jgi:hypothetical protein